MKCIDFDKRFAAYMAKWAEDHEGAFKNADEMEAQAPDLYVAWTKMPADWLDGVAPCDYFTPYEDPAELVNWLLAYHKRRVSVPDQLFERIVDLGEVSAEPLMALAADLDAPDAARVSAINLLGEIGTRKPLDMCVELLCARKQKKDILESCAELLTNLGEAVKAPLLLRAPGLEGDALASCLDILCNFPGDERIYKEVIDAFRKDDTRRALYASFLGKLGNEKAVEPLQAALTLSELTYLDYIEIANAIESLGGEVNVKREFAGDPFYESLKRMQ